MSITSEHLKASNCKKWFACLVRNQVKKQEKERNKKYKRKEGKEGKAQAIVGEERENNF